MRLTTLLRRRVLAGAVTLAGVLGGTALAQQPAPVPTADVKVDKNTGALIVPLGGVVKFAATKGIADTIVQNEDVLQARPDPMNPKGLLLTGRQIRRGAHRSTAELEAAIAAFVAARNADPKPFRWTKSADDIPAPSSASAGARSTCRLDVARNLGIRTLG